MASCKGFLNHKEELRVDSAKESKEYVLQFPLASITAPVLIDNIFYDFDKATLTPASTKSLDELVGLLEGESERYHRAERALRLQGQCRIQQAIVSAPCPVGGQLSDSPRHREGAPYPCGIWQGATKESPQETHREISLAQGGR